MKHPSPHILGSCPIHGVAGGRSGPLRYHLWIAEPDRAIGACEFLIDDGGELRPCALPLLAYRLRGDNEVPESVLLSLRDERARWEGSVSDPP